jgi:hypothetical protein
LKENNKRPALSESSGTTTYDPKRPRVHSPQDGVPCRENPKWSPSQQDMLLNKSFPHQANSPAPRMNQASRQKGHISDARLQLKHHQVMRQPEAVSPHLRQKPHSPIVQQAPSPPINNHLPRADVNAPCRQIFSNDYPLGSHNPTRSPRRFQLTGKRLYQFISGFTNEIIAMRPWEGLSTYFRLPPIEHATLAVHSSSGTSRSLATLFNGSCRYRLRLCFAKSDQEVTRGTWTVLPTSWPEQTFVTVNGTPVFPPREQDYLELTTSIKLGKNNVVVSLPNVTANHKKDCSSYMRVEIIKVIDHDSAIAMIRQAPCIPAVDTKQEIQRRLEGPKSNDIIVENKFLDVSLADPFSLAMFEVPVRGIGCKHLECFDLETWLRTRPKKPSPDSDKEPCLVDVWGCPICGLDARPVSLRVDGYFSQVRAALIERDQSHIKQIKAHANGEWTPVVETDVASGEGSATRKGVREVIELLDDD